MSKELKVNWIRPKLTFASVSSVPKNTGEPYDGDIIKGYLCYTMITSQNLSSEAQIKNLLRRKTMFCSQDTQVLCFQQSHNLPNLWCHYEYWYMRQGALLNISFET